MAQYVSPATHFCKVATNNHILSALVGQYFYIPSELITPRQLATVLNEELTAAGRPERVEVKPTSREAFVKAQELFSVIPGSEEMWGNQGQSSFRLPVA